SILGRSVSETFKKESCRVGLAYGRPCRTYAYDIQILLTGEASGTAKRLILGREGCLTGVH
ncbi:hypothetical protein, partial [Mesorhizobium sp. M4A.F.Ca.ET.050.02.1.1]|uniref:hypothetical protein n=1 Tax=Mesorhizobium sp. M4A.F.Ca.ET.050.02.1.1 TaxID=2496754 RepID=UPI001AECC1D3